MMEAVRTRLHGVTAQKTAIFVKNAFRKYVFLAHYTFQLLYKLNFVQCYDRSISFCLCDRQVVSSFLCLGDFRMEIARRYSTNKLHPVCSVFLLRRNSGCSILWIQPLLVHDMHVPKNYLITLYRLFKLSWVHLGLAEGEGMLHER
jgi:hypothetical protein